MAEAATKTCNICNTANPPEANFCLHCGSPFPRGAPEQLKPEPAWEVSLDDAPAEREAAEITDRAVESLLETTEPDLLDTEQPDDAATGTPPPPPPEQAAPRFILEGGAAAGASFDLDRRENTVGSRGTVDLSKEPHAGPLAATVIVEGNRLLIRDEGSTNGVYLKLREPARLKAGDLFVVGDHLLRYDGAVDLSAPPRDAPYLGSPRPQGPVVRVTEIVRGGKPGRICHRKGPMISVGRSGCDLSFSRDEQIGARHAEIRLSPDGNASLADLGTGRSGVLLRLRPKEMRELKHGDVLRVGDQVLRLNIP
jgi:hypothetical protein